MKTRAMDRPLIDRNLMLQREVFQAQRCSGSEKRDDASEQGGNDRWHGSTLIIMEYQREK
jgi:hypothetical protein